jgi:hypothetical protein
VCDQGTWCTRHVVSCSSSFLDDPIQAHPPKDPDPELANAGAAAAAAFHHLDPLSRTIRCSYQAHMAHNTTKHKSQLPSLHTKLNPFATLLMQVNTRS